MLRWDVFYYKGLFKLTFDKFCKQVKEILEIESLTKMQARALMTMYLLRTSVDKAAKQLEEK